MCTVGQRSRSVSEGSASLATGSSYSISASGSLCENLEMRVKSTPRLVAERRKRVTSAPPIRTPITTVQPTAAAPSSSNYQGLATPSPLQRRRSFTALQQSFPSRAEMLKDIFTVYPAPEPQAASRFKQRPSSAVSLRAGKIPNLRKTNPWI